MWRITCNGLNSNGLMLCIDLLPFRAIKINVGIILPYFFRYKTEVFSFQNNPKNLDPSYKMDLVPKNLDPSYKMDLDLGIVNEG